MQVHYNIFNNILNGLKSLSPGRGIGKTKKCLSLSLSTNFN